MMDATVFLQIAWSSVTGASFYVLVAVAFALYLKVTTYWNFAQAAQIGIAFYVLYALVRVLGWPDWAALAATFVVVATFGLALEVWGFRVLRRRNSPHLTYFIFTFMVAQFVGFLLMLLGGTEPRSLVASLFMPGSLVAGVSITSWDIEAIAATLLILTGIAFLLTRTAAGERILAVSDNRQLAELYGISVERIYLLTSIVCALPLVVAVWLFGTRTTFLPTTGLDLLLIATVASILGGVGSVIGAAVAALAISLMRGFSIFVVPSIWENALVYFALVLAVVFLPRGFGGLWNSVLARRRASRMSQAASSTRPVKVA
ncbi:MAG: branched-chain amino acid ABC transporter permease [Roseomonas sp.]|jgi:branched-chain amino acid transport system permease protein|nr:branched-chain amino acid ABC transporter permease [Roseomonas sp.]MCA3343922.1 branched-chain amino acid ABC transporter permease [Roseomonas sp.]